MDHRNKMRLLIADDHTLVAEAFKNLLEPEFEVVGIANDGRSLLRAARELKPDVFVVDIGMPLLNGLDAAEQIKDEFPKAKIIFLTMNSDPAIAADALRRGASGYLVKNAAASELLVAIRDVLEGKSYLSPLITKDTVELLIRSQKGSPKITKRQREILQLLAEGHPMKEIAYILDIKPGTVAFHKYRIMAKLQLNTNTELLQYAIKHHLLAA